MLRAEPVTIRGCDALYSRMARLARPRHCRGAIGGGVHLPKLAYYFGWHIILAGWRETGLD